MHGSFDFCITILWRLFRLRLSLDFIDLMVSATFALKSSWAFSKIHKSLFERRRGPRLGFPSSTASCFSSSMTPSLTFGRTDRLVPRTRFRSPWPSKARMSLPGVVPPATSGIFPWGSLPGKIQKRPYSAATVRAPRFCCCKLATLSERSSPSSPSTFSREYFKRYFWLYSLRYDIWAVVLLLDPRFDTTQNFPHTFPSMTRLNTTPSVPEAVSLLPPSLPLPLYNNRSVYIESSFPIESSSLQARSSFYFLFKMTKTVLNIYLFGRH